MSTASRPPLFPTQPTRRQPDRTRIRQKLQAFAFTDLFIDELGWDQLRQPSQPFVVDDTEILLDVLAEKRGVIVLHCPDLLDSARRRKLEQQVAKRFREHLIVYTDAAKTTQIWQWARREAGKPLAVREQRIDQGQAGERVVQSLAESAFGLEEEETLTLVDVTSRVRASFDVERVTKRFYDRFKSEHSVFLKFIQGISDTADARWYASVMLNRLMFVYFIQKKGFLAGNPDYLAAKLAESDATEKNFYRDFLRPLFFEGLAKSKNDRTQQVKTLLGEVPYLNGGIFLLHPLEEQYPPIAIENSAFAKLFTFFDQYQWHLDERPLKNDNEINPDVLGYIFEKYINQKQMGAYYTKEDITEYISQNTVIPFLLDAINKEVRIAFEGEESVWALLQSDPDRYIYAAVQKGIYDDAGNEQSLPPHIEAGINDVAQRGSWNTPTPDEFALPTEIWRETVARRQRYFDLRQQLAAGQVKSVNDLITLNLDIRQFAQDIITYTDSTSLVRAAWKALNSITILDPTCGSGAFLFAALNILEPLYAVTLKRMEEFVGADEPAPTDGAKVGPPDFRDYLTEINSHPNRRYAILKRIIVNNLFGVDIMEEAIEICKLRLFLKLVAQVDDARRIEPLPDIDFNIRAGNTLVGFATEAEVERALTTTQRGQGKLLFAEDKSALEAIKEKAQDIARLYKRFREQQTRDPHNVTPDAKAELRRRLGILDEELNQLLARQYGVDPSKEKAYKTWRANHQPFHWYVEFFEVLDRGGFDVLVGNPPYVEYKNVRNTYKVLNYFTEDCRDLYAYTMERAIQVGGNQSYIGMIVPISIVSTDGFESLRNLYIQKSDYIWASGYAERPSKLFTGVEKRLAIWIASLGKNPLFALSKYRRWQSIERDYLLKTLQYVSLTKLSQLLGTSMPKIHTAIEDRILKRLATNRPVKSFFKHPEGHSVYYTRKLRYFVQFLDFVPQVTDDTGKVLPPSELKEMLFTNEAQKGAALAALNSTTFFWFLTVHSDVRNVNKREIENFPLSLDSISPDSLSRLIELSNNLMESFRDNARVITNHYRKFGVLHIQSFQPRLSKSIIDEVDRVLARHYGFTDEELDFIINYDIKYRMGDELSGDDDDEDGA